MTGLNATIFALTVLTIGIVVAAGWRAVRVWRRYRGTRLVTCPETGHRAAIAVDARAAALNSLVERDPDLHLASCSRWATRGHCDESCLPQVAAGGEDTTVLHLVQQWFTGKPCRLCGKPINEVAFLDHRAALLDASGCTHEWSDLPAEKLPELLRAYAPVCWSCHVAETFRRVRPDLVTDRDRTGETHP